MGEARRNLARSCRSRPRPPVGQRDSCWRSTDRRSSDETTGGNARRRPRRDGSAAMTDSTRSPASRDRRSSSSGTQIARVQRCENRLRTAATDFDRCRPSPRSECVHPPAGLRRGRGRSTRSRRSCRPNSGVRSRARCAGLHRGVRSAHAVRARGLRTPTTRRRCLPDRLPRSDESVREFHRRASLRSPAPRGWRARQRRRRPLPQR